VLLNGRAKGSRLTEIMRLNRLLKMKLSLRFLDESIQRSNEILTRS
jgi:hypothetical protein